MKPVAKSSIINVQMLALEYLALIIKSYVIYVLSKHHKS